MSITVVSQKRDQAKAAAKVLAAVPGVQGVCVFGSVARGRPRVGSDIDLLVLGADERLSPSMLLRQMPAELRTAQLSLAYHTAGSLDRHLHRWSRFGAHLRREGWILYDPLGELRRALATDIPVSTAEEIAVQRRHLNNYTHLERFGGRFMFTLTHLYRIGRTVVFAILAEHGTLEFDRERAFRAVMELHPDRVADAAAIARLAPFYERATRRLGDGILPFDPVGCEAEVIQAREAITRLLALSGQVS
jgi:predicted nucleotidyltransferase